MASRTRLIEVTYHDDDDTGMYKIGEIDFGICGTLEDYLESFGYEGKKDIIKTLSYLIYEVENIWRSMPQKSGEQACTSTK